MHHSAGHAGNWFSPDRRRGGVAFVAWQRHSAQQLLAEPVQCLFDHISHRAASFQGSTLTATVHRREHLSATATYGKQAALS
jgi:hypothetical protein